jgi:hypothetical protein
VVDELEPQQSWRWSGPFLWLTVRYDHRFEAVGDGEVEIRFAVDGEGAGIAVFGRLFAIVYARDLDKAIPRLVRELEG